MEDQKQLDMWLVVSKKTYSFSKRKSIVEWKSEPFVDSHFKLQYPANFELRFVNANLAGKSLRDEFPELQRDWCVQNTIRNAATHIVDYNSGLTDIVLYIKNLKLAIIVESHTNKHDEYVKAESLDELQRIVG